MKPSATGGTAMLDPGYQASTRDLGLFFGEGHAALGAELEGLAGPFSALPHEDTPERGEVDAAVCALRDSGLYRLLVPAPGERSIDVRSLCLVREMLGYASPLADAIYAVQGLGTFPILVAGTDRQKERYADPCARGAAISAFALTEPEAGSDVGSLRTSALAVDGGYVLEGEKTLISNVGIANHYVLFATVNPSAGKRGITAFIVDGDTPGLGTEPLPMSVPHPIGRLRLSGCFVPTSARLGEEGGGLKLALRTLDTFRVSVGAAAVGMARRALDETLARVRGRRQFGATLGEQQTVQGYLAEMATEIDASRLLVLRAAHARDSGRDRTPIEAAMAKMYATEAAQRVIDRAVQLHGGLGVTLGSTVERLYREIRPLRIYEGTTEIQRVIIARELLAAPTTATRTP